LLINGNLWKYLLVGLSGIAVNELWKYLLAGFVGPIIADILAIEISIITNFVFNEYWTFKNRKLSRNMRSVLRRFYMHNAASFFGLTINFAVFVLLSFAGINILVANMVGIFVAFAVSYLLSSQVVWINERDN
jgi:dolichol-phosphate mannosyltransferase